MSRKVEVVPLEEAKEQVSRVCIRLALLYMSFAKTLTNELGEDRGKQLLMKAIKDYGSEIGRRVKVDSSSRGLENRPSNYQEDIPSYGMHVKLEVVDISGEKRQRLYGCVMGKIWDEAGQGRLGRLYCYVDPVKYMAFNRDFKLVHTRCLLDGDAYCEFAIRPTTDEDKMIFDMDYADLSQIDK